MDRFLADDIPAPVRAHLPRELVLEFPKQGETSVVAFAVGDDETRVIKRSSEPPYNSWLEVEHRALEALQSCGLPTPSPCGLYRAGDATEADVWLVMTRVPGEPMWGVIERTPDADARAAWFRRLGEMLARIHLTPVPDALQGRDRTPWIERMLRRAKDSLGNGDDIDGTPELLERLERERPRDVPEVLIHGDFNLENVLVEGDAITGVIDWAGAGPGDPRYDVALALLTEPEIHLETSVVTAFFDGYRGAALSPDLHRYFADLYEFF